MVDITNVHALIGGIGCGKTQASIFFAALGAKVIDLDEINRDLLKNTDVLCDIKHLIKHELGQKTADLMIDANTSHHPLNKNLLREYIFNFPHFKQALENYLHPKIFNQMQSLIKDWENSSKQTRAPYVLIAIPLFDPKKIWGEYTQRIIDIYCEDSIRLERLKARGLDGETALNIMHQQATHEERLSWCDYRIDNSGHLVQLKQNVATVHQCLVN